jgi:glycosyltransferase involved in cell wall biosynthesis
MRVGFDITPLSLPRSGIGTYTANLFEHLQDYAEVIPLTPLRMNKTVWMQVALPLQSRQLRLDVCHFPNNVGSLMMRCPTVITIHDTTLWKFPNFHYAKRLVSMRPFIPLAARRAAAIITVSHSAKQDIIDTLHIPASKVHVIYEAAATAFCPLPENEAWGRVGDCYQLPEKFVVFIGTLEPRKNLLSLLKAFSALHRDGLISHHLLLIGATGWKTKDIFETIKAYQLEDVVRHLGYVPQPDLVALLNLADAMIFPSFYEGFGLPVVEAMACGTPVVTTRCGALAEVAGEAAEFVEPANIDSIAQGLYRVLTNPVRQQELRAAGFVNASQFNWRLTAEQTLNVYHDVMQK